MPDIAGRHFPFVVLIQSMRLMPRMLQLGPKLGELRSVACNDKLWPKFIYLSVTTGDNFGSPWKLVGE
eukprot:2825866-Lingulodinium_polyedra.AAC.1